ncbi:MAG: 30S ribosome-binding factor RbfA [Firmicutes bacterium]|nr:30S ribosome-binding factor RbfA [Bacillota bacterium]
MSNHKIARISAQVSRAISEIIANEIRDEILKSVTITGCVVTKDLSYAKIYFTSLSKLPKEEIEKELNEASHFIRGHLSGKVDLRHTPELKFIYDESIEYGEKIERLLKEI